MKKSCVIKMLRVSFANDNRKINWMNSLLEHTHNHISALCQKHRVRHLYAFGSVLTPHFSDQSDVNFLVDFKTEEITDYFSNYFELKYALEEVLGRAVDLVEEKAIRNPIFRRNIDRTKASIYRA